MRTRTLDINPSTNATKLRAAKSTQWDNNGNLLLTVDLGDTATLSTCALDETTAADEVTTLIGYAQNLPTWKWAPSEVKACADEACTNVLRHRRFYYDGLVLGAIDAGNLTREEAWSSYPGETATWPASTFTYDPYGNIVSAKDPACTADANCSGTTFTWMDSDPGTNDNHAFLHGASATVARGKPSPVTLSTAMEWDVRFGVPRKTTSLTGRKVTGILDNLGRVTEVRSTPPSDPNGAEVVLANYEYSLLGASGDLSSNWVRTLSRFGTGASDTLETRSYLDGLGRTVQTKHQAEPDPVDQTTRWITAAARHGYLGADVTTLPWFTATSAYSAMSLSDSNPAVASRVVDFDWAARPASRKLLLPGGASHFATTSAYSLWDTTVTDPRGFQSLYRTDASGRVVLISQNGGAAQSTLTFDRVGSLTQMVDPIGATTRMYYDTRGLRRKLEDPDSSNCGTPSSCPWTFAFDASGSLVEQVDAKGQVIRFSRDSSAART